MVDLLPNDKYHGIVRQAAEVPLASPGKGGGLANVVREDIMMEEEDEIKETILGDFFDEFTTRAVTGRLLSTHHTSPTASLPPSSADCTPLAPPLQAPLPTYIYTPSATQSKQSLQLPTSKLKREPICKICILSKGAQ